MKTIGTLLALFAVLALLGCSSSIREQGALSGTAENLSVSGTKMSVTANPEGRMQGIFVEKCAGKGLSDYNLIFMCLPDIEVDINTLTVMDCASLDINNFQEECQGTKRNTCEFFLTMTKSGCASALAKAKNDVSICRAVKGINAEACEAEVRGQGEKYAQEQTEKAMKIRKMAVEQNDQTLCTQLGKGIGYETCVTGVAVKRKDPALCEGFKYGRDLCQLEVEKEIKKAEVEEKALRLNDENLCKELPQIGLAELCVTKIAVKRKDASLCETLEYGTDFCKAEVEKEVKKT